MSYDLPFSTVDDASQHLDRYEGFAKTFIERYLNDPSFALALTERVAVALPAQNAIILTERAINMLMLVTEDGTLAYSREIAVRSAPALEFLARHARALRPEVIPPECIPSDPLIDAYLKLYTSFTK